MALIAFRLYLPTLVLNYANKTLNRIPDYSGHIDDIRLHLWRGAYTAIGIKLEKTGGRVPVPFFSADRIDTSVHWRALFQGQIVSKIKLVHPTLNFVASDKPAEQQTEIDGSWQDRMEELLPLRISRLRVQNGEIHFRNFQAVPPVDIYVDQIDALAENLTNRRESYKTLKATLEANGRAMQSGRLYVKTALDPFAERPTFETQVRLEQLAVPSLNSFLAHYLAVEAKTGTLNFYLEGKATDGEFDGYAKPLIDHLDVIHIKERASLGEILKGIAVKLVSYAFKNHEKDRLGSRVPIHGTVDQPKAGIWMAVASFFKNWFVKALDRGFDGM